MVKYGDELLNRKVLRWFSRPNLTLSSKEIKEILKHKRDGTDLHIFVKRDNDEGRDFYYLGQADLILGTEKEEVTKDKNQKDTNVVTMNLEFRNEIPKDVFDYFMQSI